jgi:hypothetical protein
MRADILLPGFKITADPRVDRRLVIGLDVARQNEARPDRAAGNVREGNSWDCLCVRPGYKVLIAASPADKRTSKLKKASIHKLFRRYDPSKSPTRFPEDPEN